MVVVLESAWWRLTPPAAAPPLEKNGMKDEMVRPMWLWLSVLRPGIDRDSEQRGRPWKPRTASKTKTARSVRRECVARSHGVDGRSLFHLSGFSSSQSACTFFPLIFVPSPVFVLFCCSRSLKLEPAGAGGESWVGGSAHAGETEAQYQHKNKFQNTPNRRVQSCTAVQLRRFRYSVPLFPPLGAPAFAFVDFVRWTPTIDIEKRRLEGKKTARR